MVIYFYRSEMLANNQPEIRSGQDNGEGDWEDPDPAEPLPVFNFQPDLE
jgi:hypothetical protein